ncbi:hypothetical protein Pla52o_02910 [Novipirellula galeiformis]|uniref:Uncharacterized protein n=1 Tax=Novipirellula galeiformis TaxID=2528004 RepID=A0A5C6CQ20_9BACT|nr:hypothetical protein Pla52o_02910 [Novipirellula galeiformis]
MSGQVCHHGFDTTVMKGKFSVRSESVYSCFQLILHHRPLRAMCPIHVNPIHVKLPNRGGPIRVLMASITMRPKSI